MRFNLKTVLISIFGILLLGLFILMTVYLVNRKVNTDVTLEGPDPTAEYQKAINDKSVTYTYDGKLPCEDCDGIEISISITKENEDKDDGKYVQGMAWMGSAKDAEIIEGKWKYGGEDKKVFILNPGKSDEIRYVINSDKTIVLEDDESVVLELLE